MKYISKPMEVDAWQLESVKDIDRVVKALNEAPNIAHAGRISDTITARTISGTYFEMNVGDWLVRRPDNSVAMMPTRVFTAKFVPKVGV